MREYERMRRELAAACQERDEWREQCYRNAVLLEAMTGYLAAIGGGAFLPPVSPPAQHEARRDGGEA